MAWIESHQELRQHPKTKRLARALDVTVPATIGHLHCFWWWAMDYASDGSLARFADWEIAEAAGWEGDAEVFATAIRETGFVDGDEIHDWNEYAGRLIERRAQNAERKRRARTVDVPRPSRGQDGDGAGRHRATEQNPTEPDRTEPNLTEPAAVAASPAAAAESEIKRCFDAWFNATGTTVTAQTAESISDWCERVSPEVVLDAIRETGDNNARSWKYTNAILQRWETDGRETAPVDSFEEQKRRYAEGARLFAVHPP